MKARVVRAILNFLAFLSLFFLFLYKSKPLAPILAGGCLVLSVVILFVNIPAIYNDSMDQPMKKTLRTVTIFNFLIVLSAITYVVLIQTKTIHISDDQESIIAAAILAVIILVLGNICPCLPFTRHTGLRLPWTVTDEDTWIIAHRLLGYSSYPIGLCVLVTCFINISSAVRNSICIALFLLWIFVPAVVSYAYFRKKFR